MSAEADLTDLNVDADLYAETAAGDIPSVSRTYQSEEDFAKIKANYVAKHDNGNHYVELLKVVPALRDELPADQSPRPKLDKKQQQLLGYAVGEMYYDRRYADIVQLCDRILTRLEIDAKMTASVQRWKSRCLSRAD